MEKVETCGCGHALAPHVLVATTGDPMDGGVMFCPACDCVKTWSPQGRPVPVKPPPAELAAMRAEVLG